MAKSLILDYNQRYNTHFIIHERYDLYPESDEILGFQHAWPCGDEAGVYLIIASDDEVIYVGQSRSMGARFYSYFQDVDGKCVLKHDNWKRQPRFIVAIPAEKGAAYERLSLEEYLIERLAPCDNIRGK